MPELQQFEPRLKNCVPFGTIIGCHWYSKAAILDSSQNFLNQKHVWVDVFECLVFECLVFENLVIFNESWNFLEPDFLNISWHIEKAPMPRQEKIHPVIQEWIYRAVYLKRHIDSKSLLSELQIWLLAPSRKLEFEIQIYHS